MSLNLALRLYLTALLIAVFGSGIAMTFGMSPKWWIGFAAPLIVVSLIVIWWRPRP